MGANRILRIIMEIYKRLASIWPALAFIGIGFCFAWTGIITCGVWISEGEPISDGVSAIEVGAYIAVLIVMVIAAYSAKATEFFLSKQFAAIAAVCGVLGAMMLVLSGPHYAPLFLDAFGNPQWLFVAASALCGLFLALVYLGIGLRFCLIPFRHMVLYLCYSQILAVVVYLAIVISPDWAPLEGAPSLISCLAIVALPAVAVVSVLPTFSLSDWTSSTAGLFLSASAKKIAAAEKDLELRSLRHLPSNLAHSYTKLLVVLFIFSFVVACLLDGVVVAAEPTALRNQYNLVMLVRLAVIIVIAVVFIAVKAKTINYSKLCLGAIVLLELCVILTFVAGADNQLWFQVVNALSTVFTILVLALVFVVGSTHKQSALAIVASGFAVYALSKLCGYIVAIYIEPVIGSTIINLVLAIVLLPALLLVGERDLNDLLTEESAEPGHDSLEQALGERISVSHHRKKGEFSQSVSAFAKENNMTAREEETLKLLVTGHGDAQIAETMGISYNTARTHVRNVLSKSDVHSRRELTEKVEAYAHR